MTMLHNNLICVLFDPQLCFDQHIRSITRIAFFHLRNIAKIRPISSAADADKLIHRLSITSRADFKLQLLTYKALHGLSPSYLKDLIIPYSPSRSLRSSGAGLLSLPKVKKKSAGQRAFAYRAPFLWNRLPSAIREADSVELFKGKLKTHLYNLAFGV